MNERFTPRKRFALDRKMWWCIWDNKTNNWSTYTCHGKYKTRKEALVDIKYYNKTWRIK